jgi:hypothetical protein
MCTVSNQSLNTSLTEPTEKVYDESPQGNMESETRYLIARKHCRTPFNRLFRVIVSLLTSSLIIKSTPPSILPPHGTMVNLFNYSG